MNGESFKALRRRLGELGATVSVKHPCASVSIVGQELRRSLPYLGGVLGALQGHACYLVSESAEDLNLSFVVDEDSVDVIVKSMHDELFGPPVAEKGTRIGTKRLRSASMDAMLGSTWKTLRN